MKRTRKQIGSLLLSVCMVFTMLPTVAFAEKGVQDSGTAPGISEITAFADLAEDVTLQKVETGTTLDELNLPSTLTVTVTTGSAMTATVSGDDVATDSEAQETETQGETTVEVSNWVADPDYDGDTAGDYTFTPTLTIPEDISVAVGVTPPQITVTVEETAAPILRGTEMQLLGTGTGTDITAKFTDANFLAEVRTALGKTADDPIYDTDDFASILSLSISNKNITSLEGIGYFTELTTLDCSINQLTELDVSSNAELTNLFCNSNQLTELDVSSNAELTKLLCSINKLTELDVRNNTGLISLSCNNNQLTELDVSNNTALTELVCFTNQLKTLDVSNNTELINLNCPSNQLSALDVSNNTELTKLYCGGNQLSALDVSNNTKLTVLNCSGNQLSALDVSNNTKLTVLNCGANQLSALDVTKNTALTALNCFTNKLTTLDVSKNSALKNLFCNNNHLTELEVSNNTALIELNCSYNYMPDESVITGLNKSLTTKFTFDPQKSSMSTYAITVNSGTASQSTAAENATVTITANTPDGGKQFKEWTVVSGGVTLASTTSATTTFTMPANAVEVTATYEDISAGATDITADFTDANFLAAVYAAIGKTAPEAIYDTDVSRITCLDVSGKSISSLEGIEYFTALTTLDCSTNQMTVLDVSNNIKLTKLWCHNNQLTALDVSNNVKLTQLWCYDNQLSALNVSNNTALGYLSCDGNQLSALDVSKNTVLIELHCYDNKLSKLDVSKNTEFTKLDCHGNQLSALDVSKNTELTYLSCSGNQLTALDVGKNTALILLDCSGNQLTALGVSNNTALIHLDCSNNYMAAESAVTGLDKSRTTTFIFDPQKSSTSTYAVTINNGTASLSTAAEGATVTITANTPDSGKQFKEWTVVSGGVTLASTTSATTTFTMPANAVEVTATYEDISASGTDITADFTDANFLTAVYAAIGKTAPEAIYDTDVSGITSLDVSGKSISSLVGIEHFTALTSLGCYSNQLTALDVSNNIKLTALRCYGNKLSKLDVSNNIKLTKLWCHDNQLTALDVSKNTELFFLNCSDNYMPDESVITGLNKSLTTTFIFDPQKTNTATYAITVNSGTASQSTAAENATVTITANTPDNGKQFKEWTVVSGGVTLASTTSATTTFTMPANAVEVTATYEDISASGTDITADFTDANFLAAVYAAIGKTAPEAIYDTDVSGITSLDVSGKSISSLEGIEYFTALTSLGCYSNQLTALDVSNNIKLTVLECHDNQLTALDVSKNAALTNLNCSRNYMPDESVITGLNKSLTTKFTFDPQNSSISTYSITVNSGTANPSIAAENATVTITANTPDSGKQFKEWTVVSGGVTLASTTSATTTFTMPANAVEVTATYEDIPAGVTLVTGVTLNKNSLSLYSNTTPNTATLIATVAPASATDQSVTWQSSNTAVATVDASGNVKAAGNGTATITVATTDGGYTASCTVTVSTYSSGGGSSSGGSSGGGSSSSGSSSTTTTTTTEKKPNQPVTAAAPITATAGTNGAASASIPDKSISDAITKAQADAKAQGKTTNDVSVALNVTMPKGATALTATLTRSSLDSLVSAGVTNFEINGSPVTVTFDKKALTEIQKKSSGSINIAIAPKTNLSKTAKKMIGSRPVYNITVSYGNSSTVSSFGDGVATVAIPYTPANGEAIGGVYAVYVDEKGNATRIAGSAYDANSGCVIFTTPHFSMYGVGYTAPSAKFTDIDSHWAKESIDYVVGRGLLSGTTETAFAPDTAMTRGMLVTALGRLAGVDTKVYTTNSFTDVNVDSAYRPYIEWAYKKGIIQGIGSNQFAPDRAITREEIAVIIANFAKATGYTLPVTREATTYADASSIGSTYKTAVTAMQQAGIMMGGTSNKFNPKSNATRAEVSSMLGRYIKLTIDSDTAQGWTLNDAGHYLYYKDGKALTGTQTIDGVKYFFNTDGTLKTSWVKDGDNWRFYSGKTMLVGWWDLGANGNNKTYYFAKDGLMVSGKWLEIDGKWYYFNTDGSLARSTKIDGYEVDENGVRKTK